jgi:hypothetical protein
LNMIVVRPDWNVGIRIPHAAPIPQTDRSDSERSH